MMKEFNMKFVGFEYKNKKLSFNLTLSDNTPLSDNFEQYSTQLTLMANKTDFEKIF